MATASILHIGDDLKLRIPVMEQVGLTVIRSGFSIPAIRSTLTREDAVDAVVFQDGGLLIPTVVTTVRTLSKVPFVLFEEPDVEYETDAFDLIVPAFTPPRVWLKRLDEVIAESRRLQQLSGELRRESAAVRFNSRLLQESSARIRANSIDTDALWRSEPDGASRPSQLDGAGEQPKPEQQKPKTERSKQ